MANTNIPTPGDALLFDQYVRKWQVLLSLGDWRIEKGLKPARNAMASVEFNDAARLAVYRLGDFGSEKITPESLERTAVHELLHIVLHDLIAAAQDKDDNLEAAEHRVVNLFERLLTKDLYASSQDN